MNAVWRKHCGRFLRAAGRTAAGVAITAAVLMLLAQALLPLLARHPQWVARQLGERLHRPIAFASLQGLWRPAGPVFVMKDVTVQPVQGGALLHVPEAELRLDFGAWLLPSRHLLNMHVRGLRLDLARDADGTWHVNGIGVGGQGGEQPTSFGNLSLDLWLDDVRLDIADARGDRHYALLADRLRLSHQGNRIRVGGVLRREGATGVLRGAGSFRDDGSSGRLWVSGSGIDLHGLLDGTYLGGYVAEAGHGDVAGWLDWRRAKVVRTLARFDLHGLAIAAPDGGRAAVPTLKGTAEARRTDDGYRLSWAGDDGSALAADLHQPDTPALRVDVDARRLALAPLAPWLALVPGVPASLAHWLGEGQPHGSLPQARLHWTRAGGLQALAASLQRVGIDPIGKTPGLDGLNGELRGDAGALSLSLPPQATVLRFPHTFRQPLALSRLGGEIAFWHDADAWHLGTEQLLFEGDGYGGQARGEVALPDAGGSPFLDVYAQLDHADVAAAKLFWPVDSMPPAAVNWLDQALVAGRLESGALLLRGDLADWPFRHNEGRFEARAVISGLSLDYGRDWPVADGIAAVASFVDNGMQVEASGGQSLGNKVDKAVATIPDFADTTLDLTVQGNGSGASMLDFARNSPVARQQADVLAKLSLGGTGSFGLHLSLPMRQMERFTLEGNAQLKGADFAAKEWGLRLDQLGGPLSFDAHGLKAGPLAASFHGRPATLNLAIAGATGDPGKLLTAHLAGNYGLDELVQGYPQLAWLAPLGQGRADFDIGFDIAKAADGGDGVTQALSIASPLTGMALLLPVPLAKPAAAAMPLQVSLPLPISGSDLQVALGDAMRGRLRLPDDSRPLAANLAFGDQMPDLASLPPKGLRIRGHARELDASGWVQNAMAGNGADGPGVESIDVSADRADIFNDGFPNVRIQASTRPDGMDLNVDGPALSGSISVPAADLRKRGITARLQRLYWPKDQPPAAAAAKSAVTTAAAAAANPAVAASAPGAAGAAPAAAPAASSPSPAAGAPAPGQADGKAMATVAPSDLPPLHLWVSDLRLGDARLGDARLETWPTDHGMHIDQLRALSKNVQVTASGSWNGSATDNHTHLKIDFAAENLGQMLNAFGFQGLFDGGKTHAQLDASWPGAPSALALANMDGQLGIDVSHGSIPEASPGVGRLFGLISVADLPRRLTLDFGDVFGKGFAFDTITGDFRLGEGNATTDNLKIRGPAADISISGRTGLRVRDYDQQVLVVPHVGNSLPVVGGAVAGPIGIAAGFVGQVLLGHGINKAAIRRYRITGSWDKPKIVLVEKRDIPAASTSTPAPPLLDRPAAAAAAPAASAGAPGRVPAASPPGAAPATAASAATVAPASPPAAGKSRTRR